MPDQENRGPVTAPKTCIVCVEPERSRWRNSLCPPRTAFLKFLSDGITWADKGRYSHNALMRDNLAMDARLSNGASLWYYQHLAALPRELGFYIYAGEATNALELVWDTITTELELPVPLPGPELEAAAGDIPLRNDPASFTIFGLLRLGVILLQRGRRLGRWLVNRPTDDPGYFCSELIAKGFAETTDVDLCVLVEPWRIPEDEKGKAAIVDAMVARSAPFGAQPRAATTDRQTLFEGQLEDLAIGLTSDAAPELIKVGYRSPGSNERLFPPVLVTPNDLARSPSLVFVGSKDGSIPANQDACIDPALWARRGRATRLILCALMLVPAGLLAALVVDFWRRLATTLSTWAFER